MFFNQNIIRSVLTTVTITVQLLHINFVLFNFFALAKDNLESVVKLSVVMLSVVLINIDEDTK